MIDTEKVEQQLATMISNLTPYCEGSKPNNVIARMQTQVIPAFIRWKAAEMNRGTDENSVVTALVALFSSQVVSTVGEVIGTESYNDDHYMLTNRILRAVGEEIGNILSGAREMHEQRVRAEASH